MICDDAASRSCNAAQYLMLSRARVVTQCAQYSTRCYGYRAGEEQRTGMCCAAATARSSAPRLGLLHRGLHGGGGGVTSISYLRVCLNHQRRDTRPPLRKNVPSKISFRILIIIIYTKRVLQKLQNQLGKIVQIKHLWHDFSELRFSSEPRCQIRR